MAQAEIRVERGEWVEGTQPKKNGSGMRKVWVARADGPRLSVIVTRDARETHALSVHVGTPEELQHAADLAQSLVMGLQACATPAPKSAPKSAPKPPTPPTATPDRAKVIAKARAERAALSVAPAPKVQAPAPAKAASAGTSDWFADIQAIADAL